MSARVFRKFDLGGREVAFAPLSLGYLRTLTETGQLAKLRPNGAMTLEQLDLVADILTHSARRVKGQGDIEKGFILEEVDTETLPEVMKAIFASSGLVEKKPGEAQSP